MLHAYHATVFPKARLQNKKGNSQGYTLILTADICIENHSTMEKEITHLNLALSNVAHG
jgi:hypothetical protein